jgi:hypothetical protein
MSIQDSSKSLPQTAEYIVYAKFLNGDILRIETSKTDTVQTLRLKISQEINPYHIDMICIVLNNNETKFDQDTPIHMILDDGDTFNVMLRQMKLTVTKKKKSFEFDEGIYYKYLAKISIDDEIISEFSFWHDNTIGYFAQNLIVKYTDKNRVTGEYLDHYYLGGIVTKNWKELFSKIVDTEFQQFVDKKFKKVWSHSM